MVEFKKHVDAFIKSTYGIEVDHVSAGITFEEYFYQQQGSRSKNPGNIHGFPTRVCPWCNSRLKVGALKKARNSNDIYYIGIASDEPKRFHNLNERQVSPLVMAGWNEARCMEWCKEHNLVSPIYSTSSRGGCWFCFNQGKDQLRTLRSNHPNLWELLLKWDKDSPTTFRPNQTVEMWDKRFEMEDLNLLKDDCSFRWSAVNEYILKESK